MYVWLKKGWVRGAMVMGFAVRHVVGSASARGWEGGGGPGSASASVLPQPKLTPNSEIPTAGSHIKTC